MDFLIQPIEQTDDMLNILKNLVCPENAYQCGCNTVQGCACPKQIMEP
jgi:hypothetical protein